MTDQITLEQMKKLQELESTHWLVSLTDISLYHMYVILIGLLASGFIVAIITLVGLVEVYRPLQRLKVFKTL